jgi:hypothetical protein
MHVLYFTIGLVVTIWDNGFWYFQDLKGAYLVGIWQKFGLKGAVVRGMEVPFLVHDALKDRWLTPPRIKKF